MSQDINKCKDLDHYLKLDYPFTVRPDLDDGGYIVEFPDLRYCVGTGDTVEEAIDDAIIAKSEWIKSSYEAGITIPEPGGNDEYNGRISLSSPLFRRPKNSQYHEAFGSIFVPDYEIGIFSWRTYFS